LACRGRLTFTLQQQSFKLGFVIAGQDDSLSPRIFPISRLPEDNSMALEIDESEIQGIIVLEVAGKLTLGQESMDFRGKIKEVLEKSDWIKEKWGWNTRIVLDLGKLGFVDSAGLGALIAARTSSRAHGAEMKLANLTKKLRDALTITKLVTVFDVYDSVDAAISSFPKEPAAPATPA